MIKYALFIALITSACSSEIDSTSKAIGNWIDPDTKVLFTLDGDDWSSEDALYIENACLGWNQKLNAMHKCNIGQGGRVHISKTKDHPNGAMTYFENEHTLLIWDGLNSKELEVAMKTTIGILNGLKIDAADCGVMNPFPAKNCEGIISKRDIQFCQESGSCD